MQVGRNDWAYRLALYRDHADTVAYQRRLADAQSIVRTALQGSARPCLNLSGGKDSIAMLAIVAPLAREMGIQVTAWGHFSDASFPDTLDVCQAATAKAGVLFTPDMCPVSAFDLVANRRYQQQFGKKGVFFDSIARHVRGNEIDLSFVGVRAKESKRRLTACKAHGPIFTTTVPTTQTICYPLIWFTVQDVFATLVSFDYPIHPIYFKLHERGMEGIRLGYVTAQDLAHRGTVAFLKMNYPSLYNRLAHALPIVRTYT